MKYIGGKSKYAKFIIPHILKYRTPGQYYVEPFVGGAGILSEINGNRIAGDVNKYIIAMWKAVSEDGWLPKKSYSKKEYDYTVANKDQNQALTGYLGCTQSFSGKFLSTYSRDIRGDNTSGHNRSIAGYLSAVKQFHKLKGVKFYCCSYSELKIPPNSIIYCDPPYKDVFNYGEPFDHDAFWKWASYMSDIGHRVLVSEYVAPEAYTPLNVTEKLFIKLKIINYENKNRKR